jgi:hypothetical protein
MKNDIRLIERTLAQNSKDKKATEESRLFFDYLKKELGENLRIFLEEELKKETESNIIKNKYEIYEKIVNEQFLLMIVDKFKKSFLYFELPKKETLKIFSVFYLDEVFDNTLKSIKKDAEYLKKLNSEEIEKKLFSIMLRDVKESKSKKKMLEVLETSKAKEYAYKQLYDSIELDYLEFLKSYSGALKKVKDLFSQDIQIEKERQKEYLTKQAKKWGGLALYRRWAKKL